MQLIRNREQYRAKTASMRKRSGDLAEELFKDAATNGRTREMRVINWLYRMCQIGAEKRDRATDSTENT